MSLIIRSAIRDFLGLDPCLRREKITGFVVGSLIIVAIGCAIIVERSGNPFWISVSVGKPREWEEIQRLAARGQDPGQGLERGDDEPEIEARIHDEEVEIQIRD